MDLDTLQQQELAAELAVHRAREARQVAERQEWMALGRLQLLREQIAAAAETAEKGE